MQVVPHGVRADAKKPDPDRQPLFPGGLDGMPAGKLARGRLTVLEFLGGDPFWVGMSPQR